MYQSDLTKSRTYARWGSWAMVLAVASFLSAIGLFVINMVAASMVSGVLFVAASCVTVVMLRRARRFFPETPSQMVRAMHQEDVPDDMADIVSEEMVPDGVQEAVEDNESEITVEDD